MRWTVVAVSLAGILAGCAPSGPDAMTVTRAQERAKAVLANWASAAPPAGGQPAVVVVGDLTGQIGDWEPANGENKRSLMAGLVFTEVELTTTHPAIATVTWADGTTASVPVLDAQSAIVAIGQSVAADPGCVDCPQLMATSATLTTAPIQTTRGVATGPVWEFTIRGTSVRVTRVAVANAMTAPAIADATGDVVAIDSATAAVGGSSVTVRFVGAPDPAGKPCGEDDTADAIESDLAVTVLVWRHVNMPLGQACSAVGAFRTATATLAKPLGDRTVLNPATGQPVTLTLTP